MLAAAVVVLRESNFSSTTEIITTKFVVSDLEGKALLQKAAALMPTADNMEYDARIEWTYPEEVENGRSDNVDQ